ncbi:MAG TPA: cytidine deaminase [Bacillota bacterium]
METAIHERLIAAATEVRERAYTPYSHYKVGAALLGKSGRIYTGCNVENVSYGATICAERSAVVKAVSEGETTFTALAVIADGDLPASPCGICRQFLSEFGGDLRLILANLRGERKEITLRELLPQAFDSQYLEQSANQATDER